MFQESQRAVCLAAITNPDAGRNRSDPAVERSLLGRPEIPRLIYRGGEELTTQIAALVAQGITDLLVDGGDGTVSAVTSAVLHLPPGIPRPRLTLSPSGTTNLIALQLGATVPRDEIADRLLRSPIGKLTEATVWRSPLTIEREGQDETLHGYLLGGASFLDGTLLTRRRVNTLGFTQQLGIVGGIVASLILATCGPDRAAFRNGAPIIVESEKERLPGDRQFLLLLTALDRLLPWLSPFWGEGTGPIQWLNVSAPASKLIRALPKVLRGTPAPWMEHAGYRSGRSNCLTLRTQCQLILDGEVISPGPAGRLTISAAPPIAFMRFR